MLQEHHLFVWVLVYQLVSLAYAHEWAWPTDQTSISIDCTEEWTTEAALTYTCYNIEISALDES
jgi:hypothetical protein